MFTISFNTIYYSFRFSQRCDSVIGIKWNMAHTRRNIQSCFRNRLGTNCSCPKRNVIAYSYSRKQYTGSTNIAILTNCYLSIQTCVFFFSIKITMRPSLAPCTGKDTSFSNLYALNKIKEMTAHYLCTIMHHEARSTITFALLLCTSESVQIH